MARKHSLPPFLEGMVDSEAYEKWLARKVVAHVDRDRGRGNSSATRATYKEAIHAAVLLSNGRDAYTGEQLDWQLISKYNNEESKAGRHAFKSGFALLPTVDHITPGGTEASFRICGWRTNDAKNDLSLEHFIDLCAKILTHNGYSANRNDS